MVSSRSKSKLVSRADARVFHENLLLGAAQTITSADAAAELFSGMEVKDQRQFLDLILRHAPKRSEDLDRELSLFVSSFDGLSSVDDITKENVVLRGRLRKSEGLIKVLSSRLDQLYRRHINGCSEEWLDEKYDYGRRLKESALVLRDLVRIWDEEYKNLEDRSISINEASSILRKHSIDGFGQGVSVEPEDVASVSESLEELRP